MLLGKSAKLHFRSHLLFSQPILSNPANDDAESIDISLSIYLLLLSVQYVGLMWGKKSLLPVTLFPANSKMCVFFVAPCGLVAAPGTLRMKTNMLRLQQCYKGKTSHSWLPISQPISACQTWCKDSSHQGDREITVRFMERRHTCPPWPRHYVGTLFQQAYRLISTTWSILTCDD